MDLVEIRKKAKSRKPKSTIEKSKKGKTAAKQVKEELVAEQVQEILPEEAAVPDEQVQPEQPPASEEAVHDEPSVPSEETIAMDENKVVAPIEYEDSLSSLKDVLMSQHEEDKEEEEEQLQLLTFMLGSEEYALNIMDIKEIIRPRECTEVPRAPGYILGIISLRGTIIPIFDVNKRLGLPAGERSAQNRIVVVRSREHLFGLHVDSVVQVMDLALSHIEPPPEILGGVEGDFLRGVGKIDERLIILLNLARILAMEEQQGTVQQALPSGQEG
jgi:purine-binding chemotaxis protein CheW